MFKGRSQDRGKGVAPSKSLGYKVTVNCRDVILILLVGAAVALAQQPPAQQRRSPTLAEVERMYLDGKITAKEFQQYLKEIPPQQPLPARTQSGPSAAGTTQTAPASGMSSNAQDRALEMLRILTGKTNSPVRTATAPPSRGSPSTGTATNQVVEPPLANPSNPALTDVETKMNELQRLKEAREKAAQAATNAPATTGPKTKRQRLDELLKQFIEGKIPEAEYKQKREKIVAEPD